MVNALNYLHSKLHVIHRGEICIFILTSLFYFLEKSFLPMINSPLAKELLNTLVQYSDKFMHAGIVKFLIVLLHSLLLCFRAVLLSEVNTIQCHA